MKGRECGEIVDFHFFVPPPKKKKKNLPFLSLLVVR